MIIELTSTDFNELRELMIQVHNLHVKNRPVIYNDIDPLSREYFEFLQNDENTIALVYDLNSSVVTYCIATLKEVSKNPILKERKVGVIDALCVDEQLRHCPTVQTFYSRMENNKMSYTIRKAELTDKDEILRIARDVTDKITRQYLGDEAVDLYINSGSCDNDMVNDIPNMSILLKYDKLIGMMIWREELMHFLMIDIPFHGTGAVRYFCDKIIPEKLKQYKELKLECFDANERGNAFYVKSAWKEYDRIKDEMTGGNRILYKLTK